MKEQLQKYLTNIRQLRERLREKRRDFEFEYKSIDHTIHYATDFSEIFAYLHFDEEEDIAVTLDPEDSLKASNQHQLGLAHLFHTLTPAIYLLPPYTIEMWSYVRDQTDVTHSLSDLRNSANQAVQDLDESTKELLGTLNSDSELTDKQAETLLSLVKDDFEKLSGDVSAFVTWNKRGDALKNLLDPKNDPHVSYEVEEVLKEREVDLGALKDPSAAEEIRVFESFPQDKKWDKRYAKLLDARALVYLRELNRILEPLGERMVLVTRDNSMRKAAEKLKKEKWFGWTRVADHLRGIETVFFDLILRSFDNTPSKIRWIRESYSKLASMEATVNDMLAKIETSPNWEHDKFAAAELDNFKTTAKLWDDDINLQLSMALKATPWLRDKFSDSFIRPPTAQLPTPARSREDSRSLLLLKNLWEFVSTDKYRDLAEEDTEIIWKDLENESHRMSFWREIHQESVEQLNQVLSESLNVKGSTRTVLLSMSALRMPAIQFVSKTYQTRLRTLKTYAKKGQKSKTWAQKQFLPIVFDATSGHSEPEDFLFLAFVLGMLDLWPSALAMAEHSLSISGSHEINRSEVYFFIAFATRTLGKLESTIQKEIEAFIKAYQSISKALEPEPDDPRFLLEQGAIGLMFHETVKAKHSQGLTQGIPASAYKVLPNVSSAKELLERALEVQIQRHSGRENDRRLMIDILNNLAYAEVLSDAPDFSKAETYLAKLEAEFESAGSQRHIMERSLKGRIDDTKIMVTASKAFYQKDQATLEQCLEELKQLCLDDSLSEPQRKVVQEHVSLIEAWINTLTSGI